MSRAYRLATDIVKIIEYRQASELSHACPLVQQTVRPRSVTMLPHLRPGLPARGPRFSRAEREAAAGPSSLFIDNPTFTRVSPSIFNDRRSTSSSNSFACRTYKKRGEEEKRSWTSKPYLFSARSISQLATQRAAHIWISAFFFGTFCEASGTTISD